MTKGICQSDLGNLLAMPHTKNTCFRWTWPAFIPSHRIPPPLPQAQGAPPKPRLHATFYVACLETLVLGPGGRKLPEELARVSVGVKQPLANLRGCSGLMALGHRLGYAFCVE